MAATDVVASLAVTLDGYIARSDGSVDYLDKYPIEEFDFGVFLAEVGGLVMGRLSYEQAVDWGWEWGDRPTLVLTTKLGLPVPDGANITFSAEPAPDAIRTFAATIEKRLWIFGGGRVVTEGLQGGAIDVLDIMVMPEAIGSGLPLFTDSYEGPMRITESTSYPNGAIRIVYETAT